MADGMLVVPLPIVSVRSVLRRLTKVRVVSETLAGAAARVYAEERTTPILGEIDRVLRKRLPREAVSLRSGEVSSYWQKLVTTGLVVFPW